MLARLFPCRKTVLGDASQSVNPYNAEQIRHALQSATCVKLTRSYRSTWEIMQFAQAISPHPDLEAMERHGEAPQIVGCKRPAAALQRMRADIAEFETSQHNSLAVIAKTQKGRERYIGPCSTPKA